MRAASLVWPSPSGGVRPHGVWYAPHERPDTTKTESEAKLRKHLIEEAKKQGKQYGLYFEDISSGFAVTARSSSAIRSALHLRRKPSSICWRVSRETFAPMSP